MVDSLLSNVKKALKLIEELKSMSVEDLKGILDQYGEDCHFTEKDDLIRCILSVELTDQEMKDYERYLKYHYHMLYKEHEEGILAVGGYIEQITELYRIKDVAGREENRARDKRRELTLHMNDALPLVRLNIEYSHAERALDDYIKIRTKKGLALGKMSDELDDMKSRSAVYRKLHQKEISEREEARDSFKESASLAIDAVYATYEEKVDDYYKYLKQAFFSMLDNRYVAEAVYLYKSISMDFSSEEAYKVGFAPGVKFTLEEKEEIFKDFLDFANFDPEINLTGDVFYNAALKFVCQYYKTIESRNDLRKARCIAEIRKIVELEKEVVDRMKSNQQEFDLITTEESKSLSLLYGEGRKK